MSDRPIYLIFKTALVDDVRNTVCTLVMKRKEIEAINSRVLIKFLIRNSSLILIKQKNRRIYQA